MRARTVLGTAVAAGVLAAAPVVVNAQTAPSTDAGVLDHMCRVIHDESTRKDCTDRTTTTTSTSTSTSTTIAATTTTTAPIPTTAPPTTTTAPPARTIGQDYGGIAWPLGARTDHATHAAHIAGAGFGWMRTDVSIATAMPTATTRNWPAIWSLLDPYAAQHLNIVALWYLLPSWMNGSSNDKTQPTTPQVYANAAGEAAPLLYQHGVRAMELWNEPNWGFWAPTPDRTYYVAVVKAAAAAIKAAEPRMLVVTGGVSTADTEYNAGTHRTVTRYDTGASYTSNELGANQTLDVWGALGLFAARDAAGRPLIDGVGIHPYLDTYNPGTDTTDPNWMRWQQTPMRHTIDVVNRWGCTVCKVWNTESAAPRSAMSDTEQASRAAAAFTAFNRWTLADGSRMRTRLGAYFWFTFADWATSDARARTFGLTDASYVDRPARPAASGALDDLLLAA